MSFRWGSQKLLQGLVSHELTAYLSIFNLYKLNKLWPYYQKHVNQIILNNSLKLSFTNIWGRCLNFVDCEFCLDSNSPDILAVCNKNLDESIDSGNFSVRGYLFLIQKDSSTYMHGLTVYVKEGLHFAWDLWLENSGDSYTVDSSSDHLLHLCAWFLIVYHLT